MTSECSRFDERLLDYLYEELAPPARDQMREHVATCARCQAEIDSFGRVRSMVRDLPLAEPPASATAKLLFQAAEESQRGKVIPLFRRVFPRGTSQGWLAMAATFAVLCGLTGVLVVNRQIAPSPPTAAEPTVALPPPGGAPPLLARPEAPAPVVAEQEKVTATVADNKDKSGAHLAAAKPSPAPTEALAATGSDLLDDAAGQKVAGKKLAEAPVIATRATKEVASQGVAWRSQPSQERAKDNVASDGVGDRNVQPARASVSAPPGVVAKPSPRAREQVADKPANVAAPAPPPADLPGLVAKDSRAKAERANEVAFGASLGRGGGASGGYGGVAPDPQRPLGADQNPELARTTLPQKPALAPRSASPPPKSAGPSRADDEVQGEGRQVMQREASSQRRQDVDNYFRPSQGKSQIAAPAAPAPSASPVQPATPSRDEPAVAAEQLLRRYEQQASGQKMCREAVASYRDLREKFPDSIRGRDRLDYARCLRTLQRYGDARGELVSLKQDVPSLGAQIDRELTAIDGEQAQRTVESSPPRPMRKSKAAKLASEPAKADAPAAAAPAY